ncbi:hypothetical protein IP70_13080 [alpha proteobacterium AAP38]|nr:hypothetical protein IP70_13080 [alpha proteobacterium AAP38]
MDIDIGGWQPAQQLVGFSYNLRMLPQQRLNIPALSQQRKWHLLRPLFALTQQVQFGDVVKLTVSDGCEQGKPNIDTIR